MSGQGHFEEWRGLRSVMKMCAGIPLVSVPQRMEG